MSRHKKKFNLISLIVKLALLWGIISFLLNRTQIDLPYGPNGFFNHNPSPMVEESAEFSETMEEE